MINIFKKFKQAAGSQNTEGQCPLCKNHCSLQAPKCMRGKAYSKKMRAQKSQEK